jgi:hypothetical protein
MQGRMNRFDHVAAVPAMAPGRPGQAASNISIIGIATVESCHVAQLRPFPERWGE